MVDIRREQAGSGPVVTGFEQGGFRVGAHVYRGGLILTPEQALEWPQPTMSIEGLAPALSIDPLPEFLLIGTGARLVHPGIALTRALEAQGIGVEYMDSRTAARTWGILRLEARWIAAALLPLDQG